MATIVSVAKAAGVAPSTVSRVFNNNPDIAFETAKAVRRAAEQLGYTRTSARGRPANWKSKRTGDIAFLITDVHKEAMRTVLMGRILEGAEATLRSRRLNLLLAGLGPGGELPPCLEPPQVDGVLVRMVSAGTPLATFEKRLPDVPRVWLLEPPSLPAKGDIVHSDNEAVATEALKYLRQKGCRQALIYETLPHHPASRARREAFLQRASECSVKAQAIHGRERLLVELDAPYRARMPLGLFLPLGDAHLESVYRLLQEKGLRPGKTVHLISCTNDPARLAALDPRLANVDLHAEEIGRAAAELLVWRILNPDEPQRRVLIAPALVLSSIQ